MSVRAFLQDRAASITVLSALILPLLFGFAAFGVDLGSAYLDARRLQGATDLAAMAAVADPATAEARVRRILSANGFADDPFQLEFGTFAADAARTPQARFVSVPGEARASKLTVAHSSPALFAKVLNVSEFPLEASAVATVTPMASFALTSRLAALDGGVLNAVLQDAFGSGVSVSVLDSQRLLDASLNAGRLAALLAPAAEPGERVQRFLAEPHAVGAIFAAAGRLSRERGEAGAAGVFERLSRATLRSRAALKGADLLQVGLEGARGAYPADALDVDINAFDLLLASVAAGAAHRTIVAIEHDLGVASVSVEILLGENGRSAPLLAVGPVGTRLDTSQLRARLVARIGSGKGLLALASLELPLQVLAGSGTAQLRSVSCAGPAAARHATLAVTPGLLDAAVGAFDRPLARAGFGETMGPATLVDGLGAAKIRASAHLSANNPRPTILAFEAADIAAGRVKTVGTRFFARSLTADLIEDLDIEPVLLRQPLSLLPSAPSGSDAARALGDQLAVLAVPIDRMLNELAGVLGVQIGEAEVRVTGLRCNAAHLAQ